MNQRRSTRATSFFPGRRAAEPMWREDTGLVGGPASLTRRRARRYRADGGALLAERGHDARVAVRTGRRDLRRRRRTGDRRLAGEGRALWDRAGGAAPARGRS